MTSTTSPGLTSLLGFIARPLTCTRPPLTASAASARVLTSRAAHSQRSIRTGSTTVMLPRVTVIDLDTPHGPARVHVRPAEGEPRAALVLGHGAGGGVEAPDLQAARRRPTRGGRDASRSSSSPTASPAAARPRPPTSSTPRGPRSSSSCARRPLEGLPLLTGGRSSGARVACRTATATGAIGVLCLAFPVHPPGKPEKTRLPELDGAGVPVLVVQGDSDPFGMPPDGAGPPRRRRSPATTASRRTSPGVATAVTEWLAQVLRGVQVR